MEVVYNKSITEDTQEVILAVGLDENGTPVRPQFLVTNNPGGTCQVGPTVVATAKSYKGDNPTVLEFFSRSPDDEDYGVFYDKEHDKLTPVLAKIHRPFVETANAFELTDTAVAFFDWLWYGVANIGAQIIESKPDMSPENILEFLEPVIAQIAESVKSGISATEVPMVSDVQIGKGNIPGFIWESRCLFPVDNKMCSVHVEQPPATLAQPGGVELTGKLITQVCAIGLDLPLKDGDVFYRGDVHVKMANDGSTNPKRVESITVSLTPLAYQSVSEELEGDDNVLSKESSDTPE